MISSNSKKKPSAEPSAKTFRKNLPQNTFTKGDYLPQEPSAKTFRGTFGTQHRLLESISRKNIVIEAGTDMNINMTILKLFIPDIIISLLLTMSKTTELLLDTAQNSYS